MMGVRLAGLGRMMMRVMAMAVVAVALFSGIMTFLIARVADMLVGLRVDREHETVGLDYASHGETGYHTSR